MENMTDNTQFWAIVELFGHSVMAGCISKSEIGDFIKIDIPQVGAIPAWSKLLNPKSIYGITPTTEEVARQKAIDLKSMPITRWDTEQLIQNRFAELQEEGKIKLLEAESAEEEYEEDVLPY